MNDYWHMEQQQRQRKQVLLAEAEQSRLLAEDRPIRKRSIRIVAPVMFRVGSLLMKWGTQLQTQYAAQPAVPAAHRLAR